MKRAHAWVCAVWAIAAVATAQVAAAQVTVVDPWVRGTVEGQTSTAAYMTLKSTAAVQLVSVESPLAARCSVHEMTMSGNVMRMRALDSVPIPAGGTVALQEGHDHLMMEGLQRVLKEGDTVALTLTFVDAKGGRQALRIKAPVRPLGAPKP